jgi:hypothetical protein
MNENELTQRYQQYRAELKADGALSIAFTYTEWLEQEVIELTDLLTKLADEANHYMRGYNIDEDEARAPLLDALEAASPHTGMEVIR